MIPVPAQLMKSYIANLQAPTEITLAANPLHRRYQSGSIFRPLKPHALRDPAIILSLFLSGARAQELCNCDSFHIKSDDPSGLVSFQLTTLKHGRNRSVFARSKLLMDYLNTYRLGTSPDSGEPCFQGSTSLRIYPRLIHRVVAKAFPGYSGHSLRHLFARTLAKRKVPLHAISYLLGHRRLRTTVIYLEKLNAVDYADSFSDILDVSDCQPAGCPTISILGQGPATT